LALLCNDPWRVIEYIFAFLGGPLVDLNSGREVAVATIIGGLMLFFFVAACVCIFCRRSESGLMNRAWPWLTLGGYGILSALLAASGRVAFGAEQALSPRYGIFGVCLMVAVICLLPLVTLYRPEKEPSKSTKSIAAKVVLVTLGATVVTLHALALPAAVVNLQLFSASLMHAKSCLKFIDVLPPQPAVLTTLCPNYPKVRRMADLLDGSGVWNFTLHKSARLADFKQEQPTNGSSYGGIEVSQITGTNLFLSGWALSATRRAPADCVVFTCEGAGTEPRIFAVMNFRFARFDLAQKFSDRAYLLSGWQKNCALNELPKGALLIKAWAYDVETDRVSPLANEVHLDNK
jgi:hypothetical protein